MRIIDNHIRLKIFFYTIIGKVFDKAPKKV